MLPILRASRILCAVGLATLISATLVTGAKAVDVDTAPIASTSMTGDRFGDAAVDASGKLYVTSQGTGTCGAGNGYLSIYSSTTVSGATPVATLRVDEPYLAAPCYWWPDGIAVTSNGDYVYVVDSNWSKIRIFKNAAGIYTLFDSIDPEPGLYPQYLSLALSTSSSGSIYTLYLTRRSSDRLMVFTATSPEGPFTQTASIDASFSGLYGVEVDASGAVYVSDSPASGGRVSVFSADSIAACAPTDDPCTPTPVRVIQGPSTLLSGPRNMSLNADGYLFVTNQPRNAITIYSPGSTGDTAPVAQVTGSSTTLNQPVGMALDATGNIVTQNVGASGTVRWMTFATFTLPPDSPTALSGTAGDGEVELTWTAPSITGGAAVSGYRIERNDGSGWSVVAADTGTTDASFLVSGLTNGTGYTFRVSAINSAGTGSPAVSATVTPVAPPGPPPGPSPSDGSSTTTIVSTQPAPQVSSAPQQPAAVPQSTPTRPATRPLRGPISLVSGSAAAVTQPSRVTRSPSVLPRRAPVVQARTGEVIRVAVPGLRPRQRVVVDIRIDGEWSRLGVAKSGPRGGSTLTAFTTSNPGAFPLRLTQTGSAPRFVRVVAR